MDLNQFIKDARADRCSDIHITAGTEVAVRRFGQLKILNLRPSLEEATQIILSLLDDHCRELVLSGKDVDVATTDAEGGRIRLNVYHQRNNLAASIRLLDAKIPTFEQLGINPGVLQKLSELHGGLVLITGPTGSGKSTTLAAMINHINRNCAKHVITVEDPIEYVYYHERAMIHQRQVGIDVPDFATALRSSLREDPDIIMVGEMRDYETISAAVTAAETGHLVLSTLHTKSAAQTIDRIINACPIEAQSSMRIQLATVLSGVITQQLLPLTNGSGMVAATEIMLRNNAVSSLIRENKTNQIQTVLQSSIQAGMHTLNHSLVQLIRMGKVSVDDAMNVTNEASNLESMLRM